MDLCRNTGRLLLRRPEPGDLASVVALFARPELVAHRPDPRPDSPEASAERLARDIAHWQAHGFGRWTVECEGEIIGFGGVTVTRKPGELNLSYHLEPRHWGHGYASEIVAAALDLAFGELKAPCVIGLVRPANPASRRVLERASFVFETETMLGGAPTQRFIRKRAAS